MTEIRADLLAQKLRESLSPTSLEVTDESHLHRGHVGANDTGLGTHFRVRIQSPHFVTNTGKLSRVACHRLVYDALHSYMEQGLHALAIEIPVTQPV